MKKIIFLLILLSILFIWHRYNKIQQIRLKTGDQICGVMWVDISGITKRFTVKTKNVDNIILYPENFVCELN